jgi:hypothetical protein
MALFVGKVLVPARFVPECEFDPFPESRFVVDGAKMICPRALERRTLPRVRRSAAVEGLRQVGSRKKEISVTQLRKKMRVELERPNYSPRTANIAFPSSDGS